MKVAAFLDQHSFRFGQRALWQTVWRPRSVTSSRTSRVASADGSRFLSHGASRSRGAAGSFVTAGSYRSPAGLAPSGAAGPPATRRR